MVKIKRMAALWLGLTLMSATLGAANASTIKDFMDGGKLAGTADEIVYKEVGGTSLHLLVVKPDGWQAGDHRPAIVCIHGGGWTSGTAASFLPWPRYFASRGAVAVSVDYRLIGKPGTPAFAAGTTVADCISDCRSAIRYLRLHANALGIDPNRIVSVGDSSGAHLAVCLATLDDFDAPGEDRSVKANVEAVVDCNGIVDMTGPWRNSVPASPLPGEAPLPDDLAAQWMVGRLRARRLSPAFHVRPGLPPMLIMHGLNDNVVQPEDAVRFAEALRAAGNRADLTLFPGARHAFAVPGYTATDAQVVLAWRTADAFLVSLGYLQGPSLLVPASPPAVPDVAGK